jgi:glycosidase
MTDTPMDLAPREFHVARSARDRYRFDDRLFTLTGNVVLADFRAARQFAKCMNDRRDLLSYPEQAVSAGEINAMGLIDEILHLVVRQFCEHKAPGLLSEALDRLESRLGDDSVDGALAGFVDEFPPVAVYRRELDGTDYLAGATGSETHREVTLEELLLLWLANANPAFSRYLELFDDGHLRRVTAYLPMIDELETFLADKGPAGPGGENLFQLLRAPALVSPHSLEGQLEYIRTHWGTLLGGALYRLLSSLDLLAEENRPFFGPGPGPVEPYEFSGQELEQEAFSRDKDWMPRVVLLAKNAFVWLDQLSRRHGRAIHRLDEIPDGELDRLAAWGVTGIWLIGVWQRSRASRRIKQRMGQEDAVASAYSLADYGIADDLGGQAAWDDLKQRAWKRGMRLASDMVPNHMGIDSRWVVEHPDWFLGLDGSPFPSYTFNGPDLSDDDRVGIFIEDGYWDRRDAAVVFKRVDRWTGSARYIYHGNDGTSMPWNDTAQLDYLNPAVREAVIQTILHVARLSPIIRFDAAMTLTKKHYQRLWFPEPGSGGDIPSRAGLGLTREAFDAAMPNEFWREVVDRVAAEAPDTLLLAEAFWLLEGYFVRTLGMHRVYNSAFMNMLCDEKNAEYRQLIKNVLEFDPQILKRFVNFMSNPDERTAIDQFGDGDKYFGVCTLMATLPGLPMFGHGQVEGLREKYGMEFRRAYWDETPSDHLVARHERQVFPLLHRRAVFADVEDFLMYDLFTASGAVDENVFAYSNHHLGERALVLYHNCFAETSGWVRTSVGFAERGPDGDKHIAQRTLVEGLGVAPADGTFLAMRDLIGGLEYLRPTRELAENGLFVELKAYQLHVFVDLREVRDSAERPYARLAEMLKGRGVPDVDEALTELLLESVLVPLRTVLDESSLASILDPDGAPILEGVTDAVTAFYGAAFAEAEIEGEAGPATEIALDRLTALGRLATLDAGIPTPRTGLEPAVPTAVEARVALVAWAALAGLGALGDDGDPVERCRDRITEWRLGRAVERAVTALGADDSAAQRAGMVLPLMAAVAGWMAPVDPTGAEAPQRTAARLLAAAYRDPASQRFLAVNRYGGVLWFNRECLAEWCDRMRTVIAAERVVAGDEPAAALATADAVVAAVKAAEIASGYRVDRLLEAISPVER